jgi:hypothetical protein
MLGVQAFVWHWLLRAGRLLYAADGLADVRATPDEPLRPIARLRAWWRGRRAAAPAPIAVAAPDPGDAPAAAPIAPAGDAER